MKRAVGLLCPVLALVACAAPAHRAGATGGSAAAFGVSLERVHEPGLAPILGFVEATTATLDCEVYEVTDRRSRAALAEVARTHRVRLMVDPSVSPDRAWVTAAGIHLIGAPAGVRLAHGKACVRDAGTASEAVMVGTANWSRSASSTNLDYELVLAGGDQAAASIAATIDADMRGRPMTAPTAGAVISPTNSRAAILGLLGGQGVRSVVMVEEELSDSAVLGTLRDLMRAGVRVYAVLPPSVPAPARVTRCSSSAYPHAKVILTFGDRQPLGVFIGSQNLSRASLDDNREIGVIEPGLAVAAAGVMRSDIPSACWPT